MGNSVVTEGNGVRAGGPAAHSPVRPGTLPPDVRRILIVGAGGFGREVLQWARDAWPSGCDRIAGFLSAEPHKAASTASLPVLGDPSEFRPAPDDGLILAIGIPEIRRAVAERLESRGGRFLTLVHPTAVVAENASLGSGSLLCPFAIVSDSAATERCVLMNYFSSLGHDAIAGAFAVLSPYAALGGGARVAEDVFLGIHAMVAPRKTVGKGSQISANSAAMNDVPPLSLVYGVPGRIAPRIRVSGTL
jgi:sugar O-acyltransferase (sialic acid O-acetyltransferase NeuD family)